MYLRIVASLNGERKCERTLSERAHAQRALKRNRNKALQSQSCFKFHSLKFGRDSLGCFGVTRVEGAEEPMSVDI